MQNLIEWGKDKFILLDINVALNVDKIIEYNYNSKRIDRNNSMKISSIRKLFLEGLQS